MPEKQHSANHLALGKEPISGSDPDTQTLPYWCSTQCQQRDIVLGSSMILMTSTWLLGLTFFAFIRGHLQNLNFKILKFKRSFA